MALDDRDLRNLQKYFGGNVPEEMLQEYKNAKIPKPDLPQETIAGEFGKGLVSALWGVPEAISNITEYAGRAIGSDAVTNVGKAGSLMYGEKMAENAPVVASYEDIGKTGDTLGDLGKYAAYGIGNVVGQAATIAPFMAAGAGGKVAKEVISLGKILRSPIGSKQVINSLTNWMKPKAMDIPIGTLEVGGVAKGQLADVESGKQSELHPLRGLVGAFIATKLEENGVENAVNRMIKGVGQKGLATGILERTMKKSAATGAGEGSEEFFQNYAEQFGIDPGDLGSLRTFKESINGALQGMIGGAFMGGAMGIPKGAAKQKVEATSVTPMGLEGVPEGWTKPTETAPQEDILKTVRPQNDSVILSDQELQQVRGSLYQGDPAGVENFWNSLKADHFAPDTQLKLSQMYNENMMVRNFQNTSLQQTPAGPGGGGEVWLRQIDDTIKNYGPDDPVGQALTGIRTNYLETAPPRPNVDASLFRGTSYIRKPNPNGISEGLLLGQQAVENYALVPATELLPARVVLQGKELPPEAAPMQTAIDEGLGKAIEPKQLGMYNTGEGFQTVGGPVEKKALKNPTKGSQTFKTTNETAQELNVWNEERSKSKRVIELQSQADAITKKMLNLDKMIASAKTGPTYQKLSAQRVVLADQLSKINEERSPLTPAVTTRPANVPAAQVAPAKTSVPIKEKENAVTSRKEERGEEHREGTGAREVAQTSGGNRPGRSPEIGSVNTKSVEEKRAEKAVKQKEEIAAAKAKIEKKSKVLTPEEARAEILSRVAKNKVAATQTAEEISEASLRKKLMSEIPTMEDVNRARKLFGDGTTRNLLRNNKLYLAELQKRATEEKKGEQYSLRKEKKPSEHKLPEGIDVPKTLEKNSLIKSVSSIASNSKWETIRDFKETIQRLVIDAANKLGVNLADRTEKTKEFIARVGYKDSISALKSFSNAIGWYDQKVSEAMGIMELIHPELKDDQNSRVMFTTILAITSNGQKVNKNFKDAENIYSEWKRVGILPTDLEVGPTSGAIHKSMDNVNKLISDWGIDNFRKFMQTEFTISEINSVTNGMAPKGEYADSKFKGSAVLGPKIGNGFFNNLYGDYTSLTMDRWLMRTIGRWNGALIESSIIKTGDAINRVRDAVGFLSSDNTKAMSSRIGMDIGSEDYNALSKKLRMFSVKKENRDFLQSIEGGEEFRRACNNLFNVIDGQKEVPDNAAERKYIRDAFEKILSELNRKREYRNLSMADLQAALWYSEKRLYEHAKQNTSKDSAIEGYDDEGAPDFSNAAVKIALLRGISKEDINNALEESNARRTRRDAEKVARAKAGVPGNAGGFTPAEKRIFVGRNTTLTIREGEGETWRYNREATRDSKHSVELDVDYISTIDNGVKLGNIYNTNGITTPKFFELEKSKDSAKKFIEFLSKAKKESGWTGAQVTVYKAKEYVGKSMFISEDGKSGFAIAEDGDIVSVFSRNGSGHSVIEAAIAAGGRKLDCFDTKLPYIYGPHGFKAVARIKWNEEYKPVGWKKEKFSEYNQGEPDVVFMVYDPNYTGEYKPGEGKMVPGYDEAGVIQHQALAKEMYSQSRNEKSNFSVAGVFQEYGASINQNEDGSFTATFTGGKQLNVSIVDNIPINPVAWEKAHPGVIPPKSATGMYINGKIALQRDVAGRWVTTHEFVHFLQETGVLRKSDVQILRGMMSREGIEFNNENLADFIADKIVDNGVKGTVAKIIERIKGFIDKILNAIGMRTGSAVISDIKTGAIFKKEELRNVFEKTDNDVFDSMEEYKQSSYIDPFLLEVLRDATPVSNQEASVTKAEAKDTIKLAFDYGMITKDNPVRFTSVDELRSILEKNALTTGVDFEGHPGISAQTVSSESDIVAYGPNDRVAAAIIFPEGSVESKGQQVNEVLVNPETKVEDLRFVIGGQQEILDIDRLRELYEGDPGAQQYTASIDPLDRLYIPGKAGNRFTSTLKLVADKEFRDGAWQTFVANLKKDQADKDLSQLDVFFNLPVHIKQAKMQAMVHTQMDREKQRTEWISEALKKCQTIWDLYSDTRFYKKKDVKAAALVEVQKLEKAFHEGDLEHKNFSEQELMDRYNLTERGIKAYNETRVILDRIWQERFIEAENALFEPFGGETWYPQLYASYWSNKGVVPQNVLNKLPPEAKIAYQLIKERAVELKNRRKDIGFLKGFFPRMREEGKYIINVRVPALDSTGKPVLDKNGNPQTTVIYTQFVNSGTQAAIIARELEKKYKPENGVATYNEYRKEGENTFFNVSAVNTERIVNNAIRRMASKGEISMDDAATMMDSVLEQLTTDMKSRGWGHDIKRAQNQIGGYKIDGLDEVLSGYISGFYGQKSKGVAAQKFMQILKEASKENKPKLFDELSHYTQSMLQNSTPTDRFLQGLRTIVFIKYLALNVKAATAQLFQNYMTAMPFLGRYLDGYGFLSPEDIEKYGAMKAGELRKVKGFALGERIYHGAMKDVGALIIDSKFKSPALSPNVEKILGKDEAAMIQKLFLNGTLDAQYVEEITRSVQGARSEMMGQLVEAVSQPFAGMETFNRMSAVVAMVRAMKKVGDIKQDTLSDPNSAEFKKAEVMVEDYIARTHYVMTKANMPHYARGTDKLSKIFGSLYMFRRFQHNYFITMAQSMAKDENGKRHLDVIAKSLMWMLLFGGSATLLGDPLDLLEKTTGKPYKEDFKMMFKKFGGQTIMEVGWNGLPALLGADISGSIALSMMDVTDPMKSILGVWGGVFGDIGKAGTSLSRGEFLRAAEPIAPTFLGNIMKAGRMYTEGQTNIHGKPLVQADGSVPKFTKGEAALQILGFRPERTAMISEQNWTMTQIMKHWTEERTKIYDLYRMAETPEAKESAKAAVEKYNSEAPKYGFTKITGRTIKRALTVKPGKAQKAFQKYVEGGV
jgi:hypothetical protein